MTVTVTELPQATRLIVRGGDVAIGMVGRAFGVMLPHAPCRAATADGRAALWLGPDEWLLLAPAGEAERLSHGLMQAVGEEPASIVDVSHRQVGDHRHRAGGQPMRSTASTRSTSTSARSRSACARARSWARRRSCSGARRAETFRIEVWRSFAPYVIGCLEQAMSDPSLGVG